MSTCKCPRDAAMALIERNHRPGCPDAGKRSGKGKPMSAESRERDSARVVVVRLDCGGFPCAKDRFAAAAARAGHASASEFAEAAVAFVEGGGKIKRDP